MIGLVFLKANNKIIARIENVQSCSLNSVVGLDSEVQGIDITQADFTIVDDAVTLKKDDILGAHTDIRGQLAPTLESRLVAAEAAISALMGV